MLSGKIEFTGRTVADCILAIEEAASRIDSEFTSGGDRNEDGSFSFELSACASCGEFDEHRADCPSLLFTAETAGG